MTDKRTRALERQAASTGRAPHDDPAHLRRLWRQGQRRSGERSCQGCGGGGRVSRNDPYLFGAVLGRPCPDCNGTGRAPLVWGIELAAYVGHEASRELLEWKWSYREFCSPGASCCGPGPCVWLRGLERYGQQAMLRAAVAAARVVMGWKAEVAPPLGWLGTPALRAINAAEAWLADPTKERHGAWHNACAQVSTELDWLPDPIVTAGEWPDVIQAAAREAGESVRDAIRAALVPWALGVE